MFWLCEEVACGEGYLQGGMRVQELLHAKAEAQARGWRGSAAFTRLTTDAVHLLWAANV